MPDLTPLKVAIVNDFDIVVRGLAGVLASSLSPAVVVPSDHLEDADVVLYDTHAHVGGWDALDSLLSAGTPVVVFSWEPPSAEYFDFVDSGLVGFLSKSSSGPDVLRALRAVAAGRTLHPERRTLSHQSIGAWPGQSQGLTARESEIVSLILQGLGNAMIASALFLSINTVKSHIRTAYTKMGVTNRGQAIIWGLSRGMLPPGENSED